MYNSKTTDRKVLIQSQSTNLRNMISIDHKLEDTHRLLPDQSFSKFMKDLMAHNDLSRWFKAIRLCNEIVVISN